MNKALYKNHPNVSREILPLKWKNKIKNMVCILGITQGRSVNFDISFS